MNKAMLLILAVSGATLFSVSAGAQNLNTYTFTSFEVPFTGASNTKAFDINPRGDIVGRYFDSTTSGNPRGFLRHSDGSYAPPIDAPVPNTGTVARGINGAGDIAGKYFDPNHPNVAHGFLLTSADAFTSFDVNLADAATGQYATTVANGINNPGQITGHYVAMIGIPGCAGLFPLFRGFLRNTDGTFTELSIPGAIMTIPGGIDDSGDVVGTYITAPNPPSACNGTALVTAHGFVRDPKGNYTTVDPPASLGAQETVVTRISDAGDIIGVYATTQVTLAQMFGDSPIPAGVIGDYFILSGNGTFTSIPSPYLFPGKQAPLGINPRANLVGVYSDGIEDHGFIATK